MEQVRDVFLSCVKFLPVPFLTRLPTMGISRRLEMYQLLFRGMKCDDIELTFVAAPFSLPDFDVPANEVTAIFEPLC